MTKNEFVLQFVLNSVRREHLPKSHLDALISTACQAYDMIKRST